MKNYPQPDLLRDYRWDGQIGSIRRNSPILWAGLLTLLTTFIFLRWSGFALSTIATIQLVTLIAIGWEGWSKRRAQRMARKAKRDEMMREAKERFGLH